MAKKKKKMTAQQEFDIMKMVLDKFLWLGFIVMGWGMFTMLDRGTTEPGIWYIVAGAIVLVIFSVIIVKEYEIIKD